MNLYTAIGNLGETPILRTTPSGRSVTNFDIAVDERYYTGNGQDRVLQKKTYWIPVVVWSDLAETCVKYLATGSKISIIGKLHPRSYTDKNNVVHNTFEIVADKIEFLRNIRKEESSEAVGS